MHCTCLQSHFLWIYFCTPIYTVYINFILGIKWECLFAHKSLFLSNCVNLYSRCNHASDFINTLIQRVSGKCQNVDIPLKAAASSQAQQCTNAQTVWVSSSNITPGLYLLQKNFPPGINKVNSDSHYLLFAFQCLYWHISSLLCSVAISIGMVQILRLLWKKISQKTEK